MTKTWTAVTVTAPNELSEAVGGFLMDLGAPGLITEDCPEGARITAHFQEDPPLATILSFCRELPDMFPGSLAPRLDVETVTDGGWADNWKEHFPPLAIGERLYVCPPWIEKVPHRRLAVVIDPGMAFGTGHHPSTRGCLLLLQRVMCAAATSRVLDIGTGSGILAIAAAKLGAGEVWAADTDPEARRAAGENALANRVSATIRVCASALDAPGIFDLVLANLVANQLVALAREIHDRLLPGGFVIGSGILTEEADAVERVWSEAGMVSNARHEEAGWVTLACRRS